MLRPGDALPVTLPGEIFWNHSAKRAPGGVKRHRPCPEPVWVRIAAPDLRIVSEDPWKAAHMRLAASRATYLPTNRWTVGLGRHAGQRRPKNFRGSPATTSLKVGTTKERASLSNRWLPSCRKLRRKMRMEVTSAREAVRSRDL